MGHGFHTIEASYRVGQASHALGVEQRGHAPLAPPRFALGVEQGMIMTILNPDVEATRHRDVGATHVPSVEQDTPVLGAEHSVKQ